MDRPFVIQRNPTGLLDLLGMQSTGNSPHSIDASVQAGIDITDLYATDRLTRGLASTIVVAGIGFIVAGAPALGPAAGEMWMLYGIQATTGALPVGAGIRLGLAISRVSLASNAQVLNSPQLVSTPAAVGFGLTYEKPLLVRPGDQLGLYVTEVVGVPATGVFVAAFYTPVRV